jgi:hypothetical protein
MRDGWDVWDLFDAVSWLIGLVLLPVSLLWRTFKLIKQLATDT